MQTLLTTFRQVGLPLLLALRDPKGEAAVPDLDSKLFGDLVGSTVTLANLMAHEVGVGEDALDPWVRWALAGASSQIVAMEYQAKGNTLNLENAQKLASLIQDLQITFKAQIPPGNETLPNSVATFRAKSLEALVPVIGAISRYSFGRAEHGLVGEVAEKIMRTADQITRTLAPTGASPEEWRLLCWNVLKAAGQIYSDSHYAEADRLLYMNPDERAAYYAQHGNVPPMTQVWQAFNQRMAMLATLASYLEVPPSAQLEASGAGGWAS